MIRGVKAVRLLAFLLACGGSTTGACSSEFASFSVLGGATDDSVYCDLFAALNEMRRVPRLSGWVLTQLTDVEYELNGLVTYNRQPRSSDCRRAGVDLRDLLGDVFIAFDWLPGTVVGGSQDVLVPLRISNWLQPLARETSSAFTVELFWADGDSTLSAAVTSTTAVPFTATEPLIMLMAAPPVGTEYLVAVLARADGSRAASNRLTVNRR